MFGYTVTIRITDSRKSNFLSIDVVHDIAGRESLYFFTQNVLETTIEINKQEIKNTLIIPE